MHLAPPLYGTFAACVCSRVVNVKNQEFNSSPPCDPRGFLPYLGARRSLSSAWKKAHSWVLRPPSLPKGEGQRHGKAKC